MNDPNSKTCPACGAPLDTAAIGACPQCLMLAAMQPTEQPGGDALRQPPPIGDIAAAFPQLDILGLIGRGGMGVVYKARQKSLNRLVALKLLAPERVTDEKFAERFSREAQALAALNHPSIVTIHDFGSVVAATPSSLERDAATTPQKFYFLLMEFVDGVNLRQAMKAGRFTPEQALAIVPPVCEALQFAHEHGIVHRDIKPENLLLDKDGRVKIADFGIAKILGEESDTGIPPVSGEDTGGTPVPHSIVAGTPQYMAPEQRDHLRTDHRADIYSLGVVLYEMLTGELPGKRLEAPSRKVQIDVRLDEIVLRALEAKPELRYQSAGEFRTQVETLTANPSDKRSEARQPLTWNAGALFASALGMSLWMPVAALLSDWNAAGIVLSFTSTGVIVGTAWWLWSARHRRPAIEGYLLLLAAGFIATFAFLVGAQALGLTLRSSVPGGIVVSPMNFGWTLGLYFLMWWWFMRRYEEPESPAVSGSGSPHGRGSGEAQHGASPHAPQTPPRMSRTAIIGACWAAFAALGVMALFPLWSMTAPPGSPTVHPSFLLKFILAVVGVVAAAAPFGTTILGWVATSQIRQSAGRLSGMGLAVFDGLLFPLLVLDAFIVWLVRTTVARFFVAFYANEAMHQRALADPEHIRLPFVTRLANDFLHNGPSASLFFMLATGITVLVVDYLIIRAVWRAVNGTANAATPRPPQQQEPPSRWQGWDVWVISLCTVVFGALWLLRMQWAIYEVNTPLAANETSWLLLRNVLATMIVIVGAAMLWMLAKHMKAPASPVASGKRILGRTLAPALAIALLIRTWIAQPFTVQTDRAAPELPRGSSFLVWKLSRSFAPGDMIAYAEHDKAYLGRVVSSTGTEITVNRNGEPDGTFPRSRVIGKVISVLWRGSSSHMPPDGPQGWAAIVETTVPDGAMIDFDTGKKFGWADMPPFPKDTIFREEFWRDFARAAAEGKDIAEPATAGEPGEGGHISKMHAWMRQNGLDALYDVKHAKELINVGMRVEAMQSDTWELLTAYHLHRVLAEPPGNRAPIARLPGEGEMPHSPNATVAVLWADGFPTYAFQTREGGEGLLQIAGFDTAPRSVKLRYKLTSRAFQAQLTAAPNFESVCAAAIGLCHIFFPDAVIEATADEFTARHATQEFEIHTQFKTGEVAAKAQKEIGPSAGGFMLTLRRLKEPLVSAAELPQFFDRPYWKSYGNATFDPKTGQGVAVYFDFGVRLNRDFQEAMLQYLALPAGGMPHVVIAAQPKPDAAVPPPVPSAKDPGASSAGPAAEIKTPRTELPWGEAVDGVQASLRAEREEWWKSERPAFKLALRNQGKHSPFIARQQEVAEVEFDGQWHEWSGTVDVLSGPIEPGGFFEDIAVVLDPANWNSKEKHEPLALSPGEHTVRVSMGLEVTPSARVISNPIKIQIREKHQPPPPPAPIPPAALQQAEGAQVDVIFHDQTAQGTPYRRLTLHTGTDDGPGSEPWDKVTVSAEQMARVLDHLAQRRFFDTAREYDAVTIAQTQPCCILRLRQHGHEFCENLGWSRQTGVRLNILSAELNGMASKAMAKLLYALNPKLKEWEVESWSEIQNGVQLRVEGEPPIFKVGDAVRLRFTFRNTTDHPITVLDAQDQMRGTFHQFTFTDEKGREIAYTSTPDPAWENKGVGEIMVRQEIAAHDTISRIVALTGWNLAGLGHPYTSIGREARSFIVTGSYFTRVGLDLKDPNVPVGQFTAKPIRVEIVENHQPISLASQSMDSKPADLAAAAARGKTSANADIKAGRLRILYMGKPWSQGKPLFDELTGYRVEPLGGCAETPQFHAELDAYNQTMREWKSQQATPADKPAEQPLKPGASVPAIDAPIFVSVELSEAAHAMVREAVKSVPKNRKNPNGEAAPKRIITALTAGKENEIAFGREHYSISEVEPRLALEKAFGRPFNNPSAFEVRTVGITLRLTARREQGRIVFSGNCETPQLTGETPTITGSQVVTTTMLTRDARFSGAAEAGKPVEVNIGAKDGKTKLTLTFSDTKPVP